MNIFRLSDDPRIAARLHCDRHVGKMLMEAVQMMSTGLALKGESAPWRPAYQSHPMTIWVRESADNFAWTHDLARALAAECEHRFGKQHGAARPLPVLAEADWSRVFGSNGQTAMPLCMPDSYRNPGDVVGSYRAYYRGEKARFARYTRRPVPDFLIGADLPMSAQEIAASAAFAEDDAGHVGRRGRGPDGGAA